MREIRTQLAVAQKSKGQFAPKIYDIILPEFDPDSDDQIPYIFLVMKLCHTDLKQVLD